MAAYSRLDKAFDTALELRVPFDSAAFSSAYFKLTRAIQDRVGLILLVGAAGSGKTEVLRALQGAVVRKRGVVLFRSRPEGGLDDLLGSLLRELRIASVSRSREDRLEALAAFLDRNPVSAVLLVDDAHHVPDKALIGLAALAVYRRGEGNRLQVVFAGDSDIEERLRRPDLAWIADHAAVTVHLDPLRPEEVGAYIAHRIAIVRRGPLPRREKSNPFAPEALRRVVEYSGGLPGAVNRLCRAALSGRPVPVDAAQIDRAAYECGLAASAGGEFDRTVVASAGPAISDPVVGDRSTHQRRKHPIWPARAMYVSMASVLISAGGALIYQPQLGGPLVSQLGHVADRLISPDFAMPRVSDMLLPWRDAGQSWPADSPVPEAGRDENVLLGRSEEPESRRQAKASAPREGTASQTGASVSGWEMAAIRSRSGPDALNASSAADGRNGAVSSASPEPGRGVDDALPLFTMSPEPQIEAVNLRTRQAHTSEAETLDRPLPFRDGATEAERINAETPATASPAIAEEIRPSNQPETLVDQSASSVPESASREPSMSEMVRAPLVINPLMTEDATIGVTEVGVTKVGTTEVGTTEEVGLGLPDVSAKVDETFSSYDPMLQGPELPPTTAEPLTSHPILSVNEAESGVHARTLMASDQSAPPAGSTSPQGSAGKPDERPPPNDPAHVALLWLIDPSKPQHPLINEAARRTSERNVDTRPAQPPPREPASVHGAADVLSGSADRGREGIIASPRWLGGDQRPAAPAAPKPITLPVELLMTRGAALLASGDPASARLFFERAAAQGHAKAMAAVADTYDPLQLRRLRLVAFNGQPQRALEWYRRAIDAGETASIERVTALEEWMAQQKSR